jgi:predicted nucleic acid-binding protein
MVIVFMHGLALLFAAQRKGLIVEAETVIAQLISNGYRISASVVAELKNAMPCSSKTILMILIESDGGV